MRHAVLPATLLFTRVIAVGISIRFIAGALLGCSIYSNSALSTDYYWSDGNSSAANPAEACNLSGRHTYSDHPNQLFDHSEMGGVEGSTSYCQHYFTWNLPDVSGVYKGGRSVVSLYGSTCPSGTGPYNPVTGICDPREHKLQPGDKCEDQGTANRSDPKIWDDTVNACVKFTESKGDAPCSYIASQSSSSSGTAYTVAGVLDKGGNAVAPPSFADSSLSCHVKTISSSECIINVQGAISCNVMGKLTGTANGAGINSIKDATCTAEKPCEQKTPEITTTQDPCIPLGDGSGGSSCTETKKTETQGSQNCGLVNGVYKCITRLPRSNGISTKTNVAKQALPDGSVQITTVKNAANTVCSDVNTCIEKTSTTTTKTITSSSGTTKTEVSCKGACTPDGQGLESNPSAGTGNGNGDGSGEGSNGTASATDDCVTPPPCDGDPFLCAILKQQHIDTCKLMAAPTDQELSEMQGRVDAQYSAIQANQDSMDSKVNNLLNGFKSASTGTGGGVGKCLPDIKFSVLGHSVIFAFSKTCEALSFLRYAVLAAAYLFAARVVVREI
jgi:hypothetical protein